MGPNFNNNYHGMRCKVCLVRENANDGTTISLDNPSAVYELVKDELTQADRETFLSVLLNSQNHLIGVETVAIGTISHVSLSPSVIFKSAILANAVSVIFCHNHPSGDLIPSQSDIEVTKRFIDVGELLGIKVLDHLIVSTNGYRSIKDFYKFPE